MTRKCFFVDHVEPGQDFVTLSDQTARHMETVLRLKPGDAVELRDGSGAGWRGVIAEMTPGVVRVRMMGDQRLQNESPLELTLALAFARSDRMELVLRQATEMGVHRFIAFRAQRSQYGLTSNQAKKRMDRWSRIAREAVCQCGRMRFPEILILSDLSQFMAETVGDEGGEGGSLKILACEEGCRENVLSLWHSFPMNKQVLAVVGPEGGWDRGELDRFIETGFHSVHLGPRVLRLETAAIVLLASVQLLWGDFGE